MLNNLLMLIGTQNQQKSLIIEYTDKGIKAIVIAIV